MEEGYLEEYKSWHDFHLEFTPTLKLWDDVLGSVKLFDCILFYNDVSGNRPPLIPSVGPAPMYVTYIKDSLRILMHDGNRLKTRKTGVVDVEDCELSMDLDNGVHHCMYLFEVADDSPVPSNSRFYFTDREIRPTPGVIHRYESTLRPEFLKEIRSNRPWWPADDYSYYRVWRFYRIERTTYIYYALHHYNGFAGFHSW